MNEDIKEILEKVKEGSLSVDEALMDLRLQPFEDIGYAKVDLHRKVRQGVAEVIYAAGKKPEQILGIVETMLSNGQDQILITRLSGEAADILRAEVKLDYYAMEEPWTLDQKPYSAAPEGSPVDVARKVIELIK